MQEPFGLSLSTARANGRLRWFAKRFDADVRRLLEILRVSPVVHADETGWRINGRNAWCRCVSNPRLAVHLIDRHRSAAVVREALGGSLSGVLVTDFYAASAASSAASCICCVSVR